jgi:hypothetical protein
MKGSTSMTTFDRFTITVVVAGAGLCGVALAMSPHVAAVPLITGGSDYACLQSSAGEVPSAAPAGAACAPASAPLSDMAGVPMALPGPLPVAPVHAAPPVAPPVPLAPPVPVVPAAPAAAPVPLGAPVAAGAPVGAPLSQMAGAGGGKGEETGPPPPGAPVSGEPILPGPAS